MKFDSKRLGPQGTNQEDRAYPGSRYSEVREAVMRNTYYLKWGQTGEPPLPVYEVTLGRVLIGLFSRWKKRWQFKAAAERSVDSQADLRWGIDDRGFRRLLHPNGVCLFGKWIIDQETPYTGYFRNGSKGLIVGRYSTCCTECRRGYIRSLSLVGKVYPTLDAEHRTPLRPANFITQEDIGGDYSQFINDAVLRNAPNVTPWRRGWGTPILLITGLLFKLVDREPAIRQVYTIAELGKSENEPTRAPKFLQLRVSEEQPRLGADHIDFRDEVLAQLDPSEGPIQPEPRKLVFDIEVTDDGISKGVFLQRRFFPSGWKKIGRIEFTEAAASYNGDFVIHFPHPPWRTDHNDGRTKIRKSSKG